MGYSPTLLQSVKINRTLGNRILPRRSPAARITNVTLEGQKSCSRYPWESVLYIFLYALPCSSVTVCVTCVFYQLRSSCNATDAALDLPTSFLFAFCFTFGLKKCIFPCTLTSLWVPDHENMCPSACFQRSALSLLPLRFAFCHDCRGGSLSLCVLDLRWFSLWGG